MIHGLDRLRLAVPNGPRGRLTIFGDMTVSPVPERRFRGGAGARTDLERVDARVAVFHGVQLPDRVLRALRSPESASRTCARSTAPVTSGTSRSARATSTEVAI